jgi:hypothetical protein
MMLDAAQAAKIAGPAAIDGIGPTEGWRAYWQKTDAARRNASSWANHSSAAVRHQTSEVAHPLTTDS